MLILTHTQTVIDVMDDKKHHGTYLQIEKP